MNANPKRAEALKLLAATGMWRSNYEHPLLRVLWWLGIDAPPPHFASSWSIALVTAVLVPIGFSVAHWLFGVFLSNRPSQLNLAELCVISVFVGLITARYYARDRRRYGLPSWRELRSGA